MGGRKITRVFITSILKWNIMQVQNDHSVRFVEKEDVIFEGKISFEKANKFLRTENPNEQIALISIEEIEEEYEMDLKTFKKFATKKNAE